MKNFKKQMPQQITRIVMPIGNGAHIFAPKEWTHGTVQITLVEKPKDIKKEALELLAPYLEDIAGIYLFGSHARNEDVPDSDVDLLVVKSSKKKLHLSRKGWEISVVSLARFHQSIAQAPIFIRAALAEAKPILNGALLEELRVKYKPKKSDFKAFVKETELFAKRNEAYISLDKENKKEFLSEKKILYSLLVRIKGMYILRLLCEGKAYKKKEFSAWLQERSALTPQQSASLLTSYDALKRNKISKEISVSSAEKLSALLKEEIIRYDKQKKKT